MTAATASAVDEATAAAVAWVTSCPPVPCRWCGDPLQCVPDTRLDEWSWVGPDGHHSATDADLRFLEPWGGAYGRLNWLARGQELLLSMQRTRKGEKTWPVKDMEGWYWELAMEYTSLRIRAEGVLSTTHVHWPERDADRGPLPCPLPEHCGWPMRLAPSGWRCRQCTLATSQLAGLETREGACASR